MRKYCIACTIKHLGQAYAMQGEIDFDYEEHALGVIGHLAEASEECVKKYPEISKEIRTHRQLFFRSLVEGGEIYDVPYFDLYKKIMSLVRSDKDCGSCEEMKDDFKIRLEKAKKEKDNDNTNSAGQIHKG